MRHLFALSVCALGLLVAAPGARAADPILALKDVRPGMRCQGLSVIRGTAISSFDVTIVDVIRGDSTSAGARLLVRVSGPAVDATGVGPGFSGSPILCTGEDGVRRNAGAISESVGEYGNKVALATPIEEILGQGPDAPASASRNPSLRRAARPLATPLTVAGLSSNARRTLARAAKRAGRVVLAAPGGPAAGYPPQNLVPGSAVSASLADGDLAIGSIGTVAYRDRSAIWAFGHPVDAVGPRALLLQDAYVYGVINNPLGTEDAISSKLAVPGNTLGVFSNDGISQVVGRTGAAFLPRTIPLRLTVTDRDSGRRSSLFSNVTDERRFELGSGLDLVGALGMAQATQSVLGSAPPRFSSQLCLRVKVRERARSIGFCNDYLDAFAPFDNLSSAFGLIDGFKFGRLTPTDVSVRMNVSRSVRESFIVAARAPRRVRAGRRIRVRLLLQRRRGGRARLSFPLRVPRSLRPGVRVLTVRGTVPQSLQAAAEDGVVQVLADLGDGGPADSAGPRSVAELASRIAELGSPEGVRATFASRGRGPVVLRRRGQLIRGKLALAVRVTRKR